MRTSTRLSRHGTIAVALSILVLLLAWKGSSLVAGNELIIPSPETTVRELVRLVGRPWFWQSVLSTLQRTVFAFAVSLGAGLAVGFVAGRSEIVEACIKPYLIVIQTTPVLAIILIALLWFRSEVVPIVVAVLMAFPVVCLTVMEGIRSVDRGLVEMARVFRVPRRRVILGLYLPAVLPYLASAGASAMGLCWKVVIAAEVLSLPANGIGSGMFEAKVRLEMPQVFAWTAAAVALSFVTDSLLAAAARRLTRRNAP